MCWFYHRILTLIICSLGELFLAWNFIFKAQADGRESTSWKEIALHPGAAHSRQLLEILSRVSSWKKSDQAGLCILGFLRQDLVQEIGDQLLGCLMVNYWHQDVVQSKGRAESDSAAHSSALMPSGLKFRWCGSLNWANKIKCHANLILNILYCCCSVQVGIQQDGCPKQV